MYARMSDGKMREAWAGGAQEAYSSITPSV